MKTVANILRDLRLSRGMTRPQLARRSRISRHFLWSVETYKVAPSLATLEKLSGALQVGVSRFFRESRDELLLEDSFVRGVAKALPHLTNSQCGRLMQTLAAAPRHERERR